MNSFQSNKRMIARNENGPLSLYVSCRLATCCMLICNFSFIGKHPTPCQILIISNRFGIRMKNLTYFSYNAVAILLHPHFPYTYISSAKDSLTSMFSFSYKFLFHVSFFVHYQTNVNPIYTSILSIVACFVVAVVLVSTFQVCTDFHSQSQTVPLPSMGGYDTVSMHRSLWAMDAKVWFRSGFWDETGNVHLLVQVLYTARTENPGTEHVRLVLRVSSAGALYW